MGLSLRNTTAIAALAFSAAAASAQNIWEPLPPGYVVLRPIPMMTIEDKCRELLAFQRPQVVYPRVRTSFLQVDDIACRFVPGPVGLLVTDTYPLRSTSGVKKLTADMARAAKDEERLTKKDTHEQESRNYSRPRTEHRHKPDHQGHPPAGRSTGPGKRGESFDDLRSRKLNEHNLMPNQG